MNDVILKLLFDVKQNSLYDVYQLQAGEPKMRKIIDGSAYDTTTSDLIYDTTHPDAPEEGTALFRTRAGRFFIYSATVIESFAPEKDIRHVENIEPVSDKIAQAWLEKRANHLTEKFFGSMPDAGTAERRFTIRLPAILASKVEAKADARDMTVNAFVKKALELAVAEGP